MRSCIASCALLFLPATLLSAQSTQAQAAENTVVRGFAGVPWGVTPDSARTVLGAPDSLSTKGDTTTWRYRREFAGMPADMWLNFTPRDGATSGGYIIRDVRCGVDFARVNQVVRAAHPGLVPDEAVSLSRRTQSTDSDSVCATGDSFHGQIYHDPGGPGTVAVLSSQAPERPTSLMVIYAASLASRRVSAGGVDSRADGVEITLMPGFPALREVSGGSVSRRFVTLSSDREVRLITYPADPGSELWSADRRRSFMDGLVQNFTTRGTLMGTVQTGEQLLYVDFRMRAERDDNMVRIGRVYGTREGPFRTFTVAYAQPDSPDAAVEREITRMLDSVRLAPPAP